MQKMERENILKTLYKSIKSMLQEKFNKISIRSKKKKKTLEIGYIAERNGR